jgi:hypothetical protein
MHRGMKHYKAPWSRSLILVSALASSLCLAVSFLPAPGLATLHAGQFTVLLRLVPLALIVGCALFTVRGYTLTADSILIHRLLWATRLPRANLQAARFDPEAIRASLRLFGNGGFFSITGYFRNRHLGGYRAFVTDPRRTVVLRYPGRTVVVSPDDPAAFIHELSESERNAL